MFKVFLYAATLVILLALNAVFPPFFAAVPNFLFLLVIVFAFQRDSSDFLWLAFFSGLLIDVYSGTFFGTYAISFLILAFLINQTTRTFLSADPTPFYMASVIIVSYLLLVGLVYLLNAIGLRFNPNAVPLADDYLQKKIWLDLLLNLIFAWPIYFLALYLQRTIHERESRNIEL